MKAFKAAMIIMAGLTILVAILGYGLFGSAADDNVDIGSAVTASGQLHVPKNYRTTYQFLGSWAIAKDDGPGSEELHVVYASPGTISAYRKDGHFPDGAVLVKEVYRASTREMTTGTVSHADQLRGWFVMVRDRTGRHSDNDVWGDGWGWSWFDAADPATPSRALPMKGGGVQPTFDYKDNCKSCHSPAQDTEWIYTDGYPPLKH